ncbi:hypothetical protein V8F33_000864 [Rhypophila sp. PSN 637]
MDERPVHTNRLNGEESVPDEQYSDMFASQDSSYKHLNLDFAPSIENQSSYDFASNNDNASFLATESGHNLNNVGQGGILSQSHELLTMAIGAWRDTALPEYGWTAAPIIAPLAPRELQEPYPMNVEGISPEAKENAKEGRVRQGWTADQDRFLLESWKKGRKYTEIAEEMSEKFPGKGKTTPNCLVKRVAKIQNQDWDLLARAVYNSMPRFQEEIESQINKLKSEHGLNIDNEMHRQIISGLSKQVPALVQKKITVWNKSRSNTSLSRSAAE